MLNIVILTTFSSTRFYPIYILLVIFTINMFHLFNFRPIMLDFACISDKKVVRKVFIDSMKELLKLTQEVVNAKQHDSDSMQIDDQSQSRNLRRSDI
jgi:hypothetical protein